MISVIYAPLLIVLALILICILAGWLPELWMRKRSLYERMLIGYATTGIDRNGNPTYRNKR